MSTHGRNPVGRSILGSVTDKVLHSSSAPVLTITPDKAEAYRKEGEALTTIVVPLDGSELAEPALPYAEEVAGVLSLEVLLVRVVMLEYPSYLYTETAIGLPDFTESVVEGAGRYLEGVSKTPGTRG